MTTPFSTFIDIRQRFDLTCESKTSKTWSNIVFQVSPSAFLHACMHACIHACMHTCMLAHAHAGSVSQCMHTCIHACMHVCMDAGIHDIKYFLFSWFNLEKIRIALIENHDFIQCILTMSTPVFCMFTRV